MTCRTLLHQGVQIPLHIALCGFYRDVEVKLPVVLAYVLKDSQK